MFGNSLACVCLFVSAQDRAKLACAAVGTSISASKTEYPIILYTVLHLSAFMVVVQAGVREARQAANEAMANLLMEQDQHAVTGSRLAASQDKCAGLQQQLGHALEALDGTLGANTARMVRS